jgi:hypothetical protein
MNACRLFVVALLGLSVVFWATCSQNPGASTSQTKPLEESQIKKMQPKATLFEINGIKAPGDPSQLPAYIHQLDSKIKRQSVGPKSAGVSYQDIVLYSSIWCQANWDETCQGDYPFNAPPGTQMCKMLYTVASTNNSQGVSTTPSSWYANDSEHPPRFRSYGLHIWAGGSHTFLNQWGSNITITNVGMRVIDASSNNFVRYATGCDMPDTLTKKSLLA